MSDFSYALSDYDFNYPPELVATAPAGDRDGSRLLVVDRKGGSLAHRHFSDLPHYLREGDCLIINRSRVIPARLTGKKPTGGKVELLLVKQISPGTWTALSADLKADLTVELPEGVTATVKGRDDSGLWVLQFSTSAVEALLESEGVAPLPPYILKRRKNTGTAADRPADRERYQTVYAQEQGSIAAPTAGLHFTPDLLAKLKGQGVAVAEIILHVGLGTFRPVTADDVREHPMAAEHFEIPRDAAETIARTRLQGGRFVAVGTTAVRTLETYVRNPEQKSGATSLFITPGHTFRSVDVLVSNFHQPGSTPILLASAFVGRERLLAAYEQAVKEKYRLFSYGDSMLML
jgi:S-adenosylmethionine:tRNA ribosyltransferase-isomerase